MKWAHERGLDLVKLINENGGWPSGATELQSIHGFRPYDTVFSQDGYLLKNGIKTDGYLNSEWYSIIMKIDEYHWHSLSDTFKENYKRQIYKEVGSEIGSIIAKMGV